VGTFSFSGQSATGTGVLIGEGCSPPAAARFCGGATPVRVEVTKVGSWIDQGSSGVIRVAAQEGELTWPLRLGYWGGRAGFDPGLRGTGVYELHQAELVQTEPVFMTIYDDGRAFFQSGETGCTGNGRLSGYMNEDTNLYDVALEIRNCRGAFAHLNADFAGLATRESMTPWDYDFSVLRLWVSTPATAPSPAALTLWGVLAE
jgi:hypothetical protein